MSNEKPGSMRDQMPTVAAWIDDLRTAFGAEAINASIRQGLKPDCRPEERFHATENGHTLGRRYEPTKAISAADMQIGDAFAIPKRERR